MDIDTVLSAFHCENCEMTKQRFLNDSSFYINTVKMFLKDETWQMLGECLEKNQMTEAFEKAHSLKGSAANCGITPLYVLTVNIVERLRTKEYEVNELASLYSELMQKKQELESFLSENP